MFIDLDEVEILSLIDNKKSQLRIPVRPQPPSDNMELEIIEEAGLFRYVHASGFSLVGASTTTFNLPFEVGQSIWVREPFRLRKNPKSEIARVSYIIGNDQEAESLDGFFLSKLMKPLYSRFELKITNVRAEPVQAITESDAAKEGLNAYAIDYQSEIILANSNFDEDTPNRNGFILAWDLINEANPAAYWEKNPLVWVLDFEQGLKH